MTQETGRSDTALVRDCAGGPGLAKSTDKGNNAKEMNLERHIKDFEARTLLNRAEGILWRIWDPRFRMETRVWESISILLLPWSSDSVNQE
jgi:hypothetical protein